MWSATIISKETSKESSRGVLFVIVEYTNGTELFGEQIDITGGDREVFDAQIQSRLKKLDANDLLQADISPGPFAPVTKPNTALEDFLPLLRNLRSAQSAVDLGLLGKTDKAYTDALGAAQAAFDPSFIGKF